MEKQLPKNWVESELSTIISYVIGGDWGKDPDSIDDDDFIEVLCIRGSEIKNWNENKGNTASLRKIKKSSLSNRKLQIGDILLEISGGGPDQPVGRTVFIDNDVLNFEPKIEKVCTNFLRLVRIHDNINSSYINNYLQYFYNSGEIVKYQGGSNNLRNLKFKEYETISIPLPPLAEQNRIVAKLDALFAQLETIKTSMAKVPLLLKDFRQQVLTQAVTGKLTEEWRKKINLNPIDGNFIKEPKGDLKKFLNEFGLNVSIDKKNWVGTNFFNLCVLKRGFDLPSISRDENGEYVIASSSGVSGVHSEYKMEEGVVVGRSGSVGKVFWINQKHWPLNTTLYVENYNNNCKKFVYYFLLNFDFIKYSSSTAVPTLNRNNFISENVLIPPIEEQQEIVSRVESLFAKADAIEKQYEILKAKIESLPQAILHKAFKGELTQQLDSDGDARELLREIEGLKEAGKILKSKKTKSVAKKVKSYVEKDEVLGMVAEK